MATQSNHQSRSSAGLFILLFAGWFFCAPPPAAAQQFISDIETDLLLHEVAAPLITAAGLDVESFEFVLVNDPSANAFVVGGQTVYIHTGLFVTIESLAELAGVLAHEMGHIAAGHYIRREEELADIKRQVLLQAGAGVAAAVAGADPEVLAGSFASIQTTVMDRMSQASQAAELAADHAGLRFMQSAGYSAKGIRDFFVRAVRERRGIPEPYWRTHPPSERRLQVINEHIDNAPPPEDFSPELKHRFAMVQAKITGFATPARFLQDAPPAQAHEQTYRYGRAVALWRKDQNHEALDLLQGLAAEEPDNPYFAELIGQIYFELSDFAQARTAYEKALTQHRTAPAFLIPLAQIILAENQVSDEGFTPEALEPAIRYLNLALRERENLLAHRLLARAYGQTGRDAQAMVHLGFEAYFLGAYERAGNLANQAEAQLKPGTIAHLNALDLISLVESAGG
ncbi:MAG: M48 family metalloprotease [Pseudomonadota bacterium]